MSGAIPASRWIYLRVTASAKADVEAVLNRHGTIAMHGEGTAADPKALWYEWHVKVPRALYEVRAALQKVLPSIQYVVLLDRKRNGSVFANQLPLFKGLG